MDEESPTYCVLCISQLALRQYAAIQETAAQRPMQIYHNVIACLAQAPQYLPESLLRFQEQQTVHTWIGA
jgi:hypothetical protein